MLDANTNRLLHAWQVKSAAALASPVCVNATGVLLENGAVLPMTTPINAAQPQQFYKLEAWRQ